MTKRKPEYNNTKICAYCGCEFYYVGRASNIKYCSPDCGSLANNEKSKKHTLKLLGTTDFSGHRITNFENEHKRIRKEKKQLGL